MMPTRSLPQAGRSAAWMAALIGIIGGGQAPVATEDPLEERARAYLSAYQEEDLDALERMLAPDAVYEDPTASLLGSAVRLEGRDVILPWLAESFARTRDLAFEEHRAFFSGQHALFWLETSYTVDGADGAHGPQTIECSTAVVLRIVEGHVVHQIDYADYAGVLRLLERGGVDDE